MMTSVAKEGIIYQRMMLHKVKRDLVHSTLLPAALTITFLLILMGNWVGWLLLVVNLVSVAMWFARFRKNKLGKLEIGAGEMELPLTGYEEKVKRLPRRLPLSELAAIFPEYRYHLWTMKSIGEDRGVIGPEGLVLVFRSGQRYTLDMPDSMRVYLALQRALGDAWKEIFQDNFDLVNAREQEMKWLRSWAGATEKRANMHMGFCGLVGATLMGSLGYLGEGGLGFNTFIFFLLGMSLSWKAYYFSQQPRYWDQREKALTMIYRFLHTPGFEEALPLDIKETFLANPESFGEKGSFCSEFKVQELRSFSQEGLFSS